MVVVLVLGYCHWRSAALINATAAPWEKNNRMSASVGCVSANTIPLTEACALPGGPVLQMARNTFHLTFIYSIHNDDHDKFASSDGAQLLC